MNRIKNLNKRLQRGYAGERAIVLVLTQAKTHLSTGVITFGDRDKLRKLVVPMLDAIKAERKKLKDEINLIFKEEQNNKEKELS